MLTLNTVQCSRTGSPVVYWWHYNLAQLFKKVICQHVSKDLKFVSASSLPRIYQKELIQNMEKSVSMEILLIIVKYWKLLECPPIGKQLNK